MGHVGITAGLASVGIGSVILFVLPRLYQHPDRRLRNLASTLTIILGHAGAVYGALHVGTVRVILFYTGGIWRLVNYLKENNNN